MLSQGLIIGYSCCGVGGCVDQSCGSAYVMEESGQRGITSAYRATSYAAKADIQAYLSY